MTVYDPIEIPELDEELSPIVPWSEVDRVLINYYRKFADRRMLRKLIDWINSEYNCSLTKDMAYKRALRLGLVGE